MMPRGQSEPTRAVGRLGQLQQNAGIYRRRSLQSPLLTTSPSGTYVAIQEEQGEWDGVLMADGSTGWVPARVVQKLDYQVEATGGYHLPPAGGSLPGYSESGDIYPRSSTPYFNGDSQALLREAYKYLGVPYVWGGNTVRGIDCSGFVKKVFASNGYDLPRLGSDQMAFGVPVPVDQLQAGDRLYFGRRTDRVGVTHTGLYIGNGYFIHSSSGRHGVAISHLSEPLFRRIYVCARR
jgi:cell wall-associated NlpC family hydrolase